jgi:hypothetical protein
MSFIDTRDMVDIGSLTVEDLHILKEFAVDTGPKEGWAPPVFLSEARSSQKIPAMTS